MGKTLADYPHLLKEWHTSKNGNIDPKNVPAFSNKKRWWICEKGHEWQTTCSNRTSINKTGCPFCVNKKVCIDNCLETKFPEVAKQWHPTKNGNVTPKDISPGSSSKKFWWECEKKHEWQATCSGRTSMRDSTNCPYCNNRKTCTENCLETKFP